jgi:glucosylceramidase
MQRVLAASTLNALCASATTVAWWQTARDTGDRLTPQSAQSFVAPGPVAPNASVFSVNASQFFQTVWGFGGAMTESAVYVFNKLREEAKAELLLDLYGENANGTSLRYTAGRLTIGSCDFALDYCE